MRIEACDFATGEYFTLVFQSQVLLMHRKTFPYTMIFNLSPKELSLKHAAFCSQGYIKWQNLSRVGKRGKDFGRGGRFLLSQTLLKL